MSPQDAEENDVDEACEFMSIWRSRSVVGQQELILSIRSICLAEEFKALLQIRIDVLLEEIAASASQNKDRKGDQLKFMRIIMFALNQPDNQSAAALAAALVVLETRLAL